MTVDGGRSDAELLALAITRQRDGDRAAAVDALAAIPADDLQPLLDTVTAVAGLLWLVGRARGVHLRDPLHTHHLP